MCFSRSCLLALAMGGLFAPAAAVSAQELGVFAASGRSNNPEIPDGRGFGVSAALTILPGWDVQGAFVRLRDETRKPGTVCQVYSPRIACVTETVDADATLSGVRFQLLRTVSLGPRVRLLAGGGVSLNSVSGDARGESGRPGDLFQPNAGQVGYGLSASMALRPLGKAPLWITGAVATHWIHFNGCADPEEPTTGYAPFCGSERFDGIHVGLSYRVPLTLASAARSASPPKPLRAR